MIRLIPGRERRGSGWSLQWDRAQGAGYLFRSGFRNVASNLGEGRGFRVSESVPRLQLGKQSWVGVDRFPRGAGQNKTKDRKTRAALVHWTQRSRLRVHYLL